MSSEEARRALRQNMEGIQLEECYYFSFFFPYESNSEAFFLQIQFVFSCAYICTGIQAHMNAGACGIQKKAQDSQTWSYRPGDYETPAMNTTNKLGSSGTTACILDCLSITQALFWLSYFNNSRKLKLFQTVVAMFIFISHQQVTDRCVLAITVIFSPPGSNK